MANDSILGGAGDNSLDGLDGDDTIDGGTGGLNGSGGVDTLIGNSGNDLLWTRADDLAYGGTGNDTISVVSDGTALLDGGAGAADVLRFESNYDITGATLTGIEQLWIAGTAYMTATQLAGFQLVSGYNPSYVNASVGLTQGGTANIALSTTLTNGFGLTGSGAADVITFAPTYAHQISAFMGSGNDMVTTAAGDDSIRGDDGSDTLSGLDGNDSIDGGSGADSMIGGNGNDILFLGGADSAFGGAGNDLFSIGGNQSAVISGGVGQDTLRFEGTFDISTAALSGVENLFASSAAYMTASQLDQFTAVSGYASNYTTAGVILTAGGTADATLSVTLSTSFSLTGSGSADLITFAAGYNAIIYAYMGSGNDSVTTSNGADSIRGEAGNDTLMGMGGADSIDGGAGADSMDGGAGNDTLVVGTGDTAIGGLGDDLFSVTSSMPASLDGGTGGNDTLRFENGFDISATTVTGFEQVNLFGTVLMTTAQLAQFGAISGYNSGTTNATVTLTRGGTATINVLPTLSNYFALTGSAEAEKVTFNAGYSGTVYAYMGGGNDNVIASSGNDSLRGDDGKDTLTGGNGNDSIDGGIGNDILNGGNGNDTLILRFWDSAYGGANNDLISINDNAPLVVNGGTGSDTLRFETSYDITGAAISGMEQLNLNGNDTMTATQLNLFSKVSGYGPGYTSGALTLSEGGTALIKIDPAMSASLFVTGSADNDILTFAAGYTGIVYAYTGGGDDKVIGSSGNDSLRGEDGNDSLYGFDGNDSIDGGNGNDVLLGQVGNDSIDGGLGLDSVDGGGGDDLLFARQGDSIYGGNNNDFITVVETLPAWLDGGTGNDTLQIGGSFDISSSHLSGVENLFLTGAPSLTMAQLASFTLVSGYAPGYTSATLSLTTGGTATVNLSTSLSASFTLNGSAEDDKVTFKPSYTATIIVNAGTGDDSITGATGADVLVGGSGNDLLRGMIGNDSVNGGSGADVIDGGNGTDTLTGGLGKDVFVFANPASSTPAAPDRITDFEGAGVAAGDKIDVSGIDADGNIGTHNAFTFNRAGIHGLSLIDNGTDTVVRLNTDKDAAFEVTIVIADGAVTAATYTAGDFIL